MAGSKPGKTKVARSVRDLMTIEDQLDAIKSAYSTIRKEMVENAAETVELNLGTLMHFVEKLHPISQKHLGEWRRQRAQTSAAKVRERLIGEGGVVLEDLKSKGAEKTLNP